MRAQKGPHARAEEREGDAPEEEMNELGLLKEQRGERGRELGC